MSELYRSMENNLAKNVLCRIQAIHLSQQHCSKELYATTVCEAANWALTKMDSFPSVGDKEYCIVWRLWRRCVKLLEKSPLSDTCVYDSVIGRWYVRPPESIVFKTHLHLRGKPVPEFQQKS